MNNHYLKFALPIALLSGFSIFGDEAVKEILAVEQKEENNYRRVSLGFDMFWSGGSFNIDYPVYQQDGTGQCNYIGSYNSHGKSTDRYEGLRYISENLQPNAFYSGTDIWFAVGDNHQKVYLDHKKMRDKEIGTNTWFNMDAGFGYNFQPSFSPHSLLSVFAGPGFHWERKFHHTARWGYAMAGFKIAQDLTESLSLGVDFKTMYSFRALDPQGVTSFERRGERNFWGIEMGAPLTWHIGETRKVDLQFKPYLLKWNLNSPVTALGFKASLGYSF